jgi:hypothetical protein
MIFILEYVMKLHYLFNMNLQKTLYSIHITKFSFFNTKECSLLSMDLLKTNIKFYDIGGNKYRMNSYNKHYFIAIPINIKNYYIKKV